MASFGVNPRPLLKEQGLAPGLLSDPEQLIPAIAAIRLLERSADVTGCMTLGLRMAEGRSLANLGATSLLIAHQPTLRKTLETLQEFRVRINSTLMLHFEGMTAAESDGLADFLRHADLDLHEGWPRRLRGCVRRPCSA